jgi:thiamine kinase-like enzyme
VDATLEQLLGQIPALSGPRRVEELSGGLTNRNLKVTVLSGSYVVRWSQSDVTALGIDRDAEHDNSRTAAEAGVAPRVVDYRPDLGVLVIEFVTGSTLTDSDFGNPEVLTRAAAACRRLHSGARFVGDFDMFARQSDYRRHIADAGLWLPPEYDDFADHWADVRRVLAANAVATAPCNNDLLAGNFIDDGQQVWLIDYEYSGNNDPCFELGNTATECEFSPAMTEAWTAAYFGREDPAQLARVRLQSLCSEYGWSLWGFIQAETSAIEFDFRDWGSQRFDKAARTFTSAGFRQLLTAVADG